jgi:hypothetical protein
MVVRIRFARGPKIVQGRRKNQRLAVTVAALLTPTALLAGALALWRVAADLNFAGSFAISTGPFSHWQFWLAAAIALQVCSRMLNRYGRRDQTTAS